MTLAALLSVVLGAAATRITHSELMDARREAARDRAEQAQSYRRLTVTRTAENAEFAAGMQSAHRRARVLDPRARDGARPPRRSGPPRPPAR